MGSRPACLPACLARPISISISFDKIYKIVKLRSLNGIFVAVRPLPIVFHSLHLVIFECACVCMCVRGCTLDKVYSFLGDNFVSFAVGKRDATQAASRASPVRIHLCLNGCKQKDAFVWPPNWDCDCDWDRDPTVRPRSETPAAASACESLLLRVGPNVHLIWIWISVYCCCHSKWAALLCGVGYSIRRGRSIQIYNM